MNSYDTEQAGAAARYTNTSALGLPPAPSNMNAEQTANFGASVAAGYPTTAPKSEVSTLSTGQGQTVLSQYIQDHTADMARLNSTPAATDKTNTPTPAPGALSYDEAKTLGVDLNTATYDPGTNTYIPTADPNATAQKTLTDKLKSDEGEINNAFSGMSQNADASTQALIQSIQGIYGARMDAMREQNKRSEDRLNTFGIREGTNRYAGEVASGILSAEERAGLDRLNSLGASEAQLIAQANQALQDKKYTMFVRARDELGKVRADTQTQLQKLQTTALTEQKKVKDNQIQATRDGAIAGLVQQGITDPTQILNNLNYDNNGKQTGDFTAKEIAATLKNISPEGDVKSLTGATKNFYVLKQRGLLPDSIKGLPDSQQLFAYLRQEKQATTIYKNSGGGGANTYIPPAPSDIVKGLDILNTPGVRGADHYVDPYVYKDMYNAWVAQNHNPKDFIAHFPLSNISPEDYDKIPSYLVTQSKLSVPKAKKGGSDPTYRKPPAGVIGQVRALQSKNASADEISNFIKYSGYDANDPAFKP